MRSIGLMRTFLIWNASGSGSTFRTDGSPLQSAANDHLEPDLSQVLDEVTASWLFLTNRHIQKLVPHDPEAAAQRIALGGSTAMWLCFVITLLSKILNLPQWLLMLRYERFTSTTMAGNYHEEGLSLETAYLLPRHTPIASYGSLVHTPKSHGIKAESRKGSSTSARYATGALLVAVLILCYLQPYAISNINHLYGTASVRQYSPEPSDKRHWSPGSAVSAVFIVMLSCVFQPAGSSFLERVTNVWRFSPLCCFLDMVRTIYFILRLCFVFGAPVSSACTVVSAARYRSYRSLDRDDPNYDLTIPDFEDIHRVLRRRRFLSVIIALVATLQFIKIMAVHGPPKSVAVGYTFACVYFAYWLFQETVMTIVRFTTRDLANWDEPMLLKLGHDVMAAYHKHAWDGTQLLFCGLHQLIVGLVGIVLCDLAHVDISDLPPWARMVYLVLFILFVCFVLVGLVGDLQISERAYAVFFFNTWYTFQAIQVLSLVLLYYLKLYDSSLTDRPAWTDWLGK